MGVHQAGKQRLPASCETYFQIPSSFTRMISTRLRPSKLGSISSIDSVSCLERNWALYQHSHDPSTLSPPLSKHSHHAEVDINIRLPKKHDLLDWDCAEALSIPDIVNSLDYIHQNGTFPVSTHPLSHRANHGIQMRAAKPSLTSSQPDLDSKEDQNSVGKCPVPDSVIDEMKVSVKKWTEEGGLGHGILTSSPHPIRLCIFDGFLLYAQSMISVQPQIDIKMFLRVSYAKAKARREARSGYVTLEGFWEDPPGYVDKIVWPNYVEDHKFMFQDGDVEGALKEDVVREWRINYLKEGLDIDMTTTLRWAVAILMEQLPQLVRTPS